MTIKSKPTKISKRRKLTIKHHKSRKHVKSCIVGGGECIYTEKSLETQIDKFKADKIKPQIDKIEEYLSTLKKKLTELDKANKKPSRSWSFGFGSKKTIPEQGNPENAKIQQRLTHVIKSLTDFLGIVTQLYIPLNYMIHADRQGVIKASSENGDCKLKLKPNETDILRNLNHNGWSVVPYYILRDYFIEQGKEQKKYHYNSIYAKLRMYCELIDNNQNSDELPNFDFQTTDADRTKYNFMADFYEYYKQALPTANENEFNSLGESSGA